jgi:uncharacterized membrane protein
MNDIDSSDRVPLDGHDELSAAERKALREMLREAERMSWARKKMRVIVPIGVAAVVAIWQVVEWVSKHIRYTA